MGCCRQEYRGIDSAAQNPQLGEHTNITKDWSLDEESGWIWQYFTGIMWRFDT